MTFQPTDTSEPVRVPQPSNTQPGGPSQLNGLCLNPLFPRATSPCQQTTGHRRFGSHLPAAGDMAIVKFSFLVLHSKHMPPRSTRDEARCRKCRWPRPDWVLKPPHHAADTGRFYVLAPVWTYWVVGRLPQYPSSSSRTLLYVGRYQSLLPSTAAAACGYPQTDTLDATRPAGA
ncbi:hypothetical protein PsAD37_04227 [Pseudovibrio sp. Ad37]|nr:hypothetical protein PsAD37_04227 [Pseudovibrio sp. Ad37]